MENREKMNAEQEQAEIRQAPDKEEYIRRIMELDDQGQAFIEGYLFARVTDAAKKGA